MNVLIISHMYPNSFNENNGIFIHKQVEAMLEEFPDGQLKKTRRLLLQQKKMLKE